MCLLARSLTTNSSEHFLPHAHVSKMSCIILVSQLSFHKDSRPAAHNQKQSQHIHVIITRSQHPYHTRRTKAQWIAHTLQYLQPLNTKTFGPNQLGQAAIVIFDCAITWQYHIIPCQPQLCINNCKGLEPHKLINIFKFVRPRYLIS